MELRALVHIAPFKIQKKKKKSTFAICLKSKFTLSNIAMFILAFYSCFKTAV